MTDRQEPDQLRAEIARTRANLDETLERIEDRISPSRIKDRRVDRIRGRWAQTRESIMGAPVDGDELSRRAGQVGDRASAAADQLADSARHAPDRVEDTTRGNPIAAGLVAFGLGAIAGSLIPSSGPERRLAAGLREEFEEPVREELQRAGQEVGDDVREHAEHAVEETKQTARREADRTTEEARDRAEAVRGEAEQAAERVQQER